MTGAEEWLLQIVESIPIKIEQDKVDIIKAIFAEECVVDRFEISTVSDLLTASALQSKGVPVEFARHFEDAVGKL